MGEHNNSAVGDPSVVPQPASSISPNSQALMTGAAPAPQYSAEYLAQLLKDKKQLAAFPNVFLHLERLVDEEIGKVRIALFQFEFNKDVLVLPDASGPAQTMQEKVYVPVGDFPDYNFVGRILGPRGMTAKQLETETGCKIMVRGRGSMRDKKKEEQNRGKQNWEHLNDELHVLVQCEDTEDRAALKIKRAVDEIKKLLVPAPEGEDELKRKQLMELAIINGTYRPANATNHPAGLKPGMHTPRLLTPMKLPGPMRSPTLGAPIILSPNRGMGPMSSMGPACTLANGWPMTPTAGAIPSNLVPSSPTDLASATPLLLNSFPQGFDPSLAASYPYLQSAAAAALSGPLFTNIGDYGGLDVSQLGAILNQRRILGQAREHPYQRGTLKTPTS